MNNLLIKNNNQVSKKKKGFTLVELVIVIAIIAILAAMAIPRLGAMRTNARVSNDVAAAKNIATIAATLVANGEITAASTIDVSDASDTNAAAIRANLDGGASDGIAEALTGGNFSVTVAAGDVITVSVVSGGDDYQLYPEAGNERAEYAGAARD